MRSAAFAIVNLMISSRRVRHEPLRVTRGHSCAALVAAAILAGTVYARRRPLHRRLRPPPMHRLRRRAVGPRRRGEGQDQSGVGMVAGGVLGGVLGHQIGGGRGKTVATVAGAAGGAYVGNKVEQNKNTKTHVVRRASRWTAASSGPSSTATSRRCSEGERVKLRRRRQASRAGRELTPTVAAARAATALLLRADRLGPRRSCRSRFVGGAA